nr:RICIN domain-containing protein [Amycolatopsis rubida]
MRTARWSSSTPTTAPRINLWRLTDNGDGWFRIVNRNSGKVLGVHHMSTADSAQGGPVRRQRNRRPPVAADPGRPGARREPELRQGARRRSDVHCGQRPSRPVHRQRHH